MVSQSEFASGALPQAAAEFWRNSNPSQPEATDEAGSRSICLVCLRICRALWDRLDEGQFGRWDAGFQKSLTIMGDVSRSFPTEIPEMPLDGQAWKPA